MYQNSHHNSLHLSYSRLQAYLRLRQKLVKNRPLAVGRSDGDGSVAASLRGAGVAQGVLHERRQVRVGAVGQQERHHLGVPCGCRNLFIGETLIWFSPIRDYYER